MFDAIYKLRYAKRNRRKWEAAAKLSGHDLSIWIRDTLDDQADDDLSNASKK